MKNPCKTMIFLAVISLQSVGILPTIIWHLLLQSGSTKATPVHTAPNCPSKWASRPASGLVPLINQLNTFIFILKMNPDFT